MEKRTECDKSADGCVLDLVTLKRVERAYGAHAVKQTQRPLLAADTSL